MILLRVLGRFIRTERLFIEDKIAALAVIPLVLRMVCVHFILIYGTNNADFSGLDLTAVQLHHKSVASGLVLLSRFFYAATYVSPGCPAALAALLSRGWCRANLFSPWLLTLDIIGCGL